MSSSDENVPTPNADGASRSRPRRPQPDRDNFISDHGRTRRPAPTRAGSPADDADTTVIEPALTETVVTEEIVPLAGDTATNNTADSDVDALVETEVVSAVTATSKAGDVNDDENTTRLPLSDVQVHSFDEPVHTEPFDGSDDELDRPRAERRSAEHLTQDPLPYIEPQPTLPIAAEPEYEPELFETEVDDEVYAYDEPAPVAPVRRGTLDLGLLVLRLFVGGTFLVHGLQKLTGWMNGPGLDGFASFLENSADPSLGFNPDVTRWLALTAAVSETAGGALLILGLLTPIAASALLGTILIAMTYTATLAGGIWFFAADGGGNGLEFPLLLAGAAIALILTGPGLYSFDRRWGWSRRPAWGSALWVLIGIGSAIAVWLVFNGANPLVNN